MPIRIKIGTIFLKLDSRASGNKSKNAAPSKAPAAKLTIKNKALFKNFLLNRKNVPIKDIKLTIATAIKIWNKT